MTIRTSWYLAAALLAITVPALAETEAQEKAPTPAVSGPTAMGPTTGRTAGTATGTAAAGGFQSLSTGNQKIARALFDAQHPAAGGPTPLTLDQIAALKTTEGWGRVFRQMKSEGLIQARNLGQVVSAAEHARHVAERANRVATHENEAAEHAGRVARHENEAAEHSGRAARHENEAAERAGRHGGRQVEHAHRAWAGGTHGRSHVVITNGAGRSVSVATHAGWRTGGRFARAGGHHSTMMASTAHVTTAAGGSAAAGGAGHGGESFAHSGGHGR